jgi:hypothetical protein
MPTWTQRNRNGRVIRVEGVRSRRPKSQLTRALEAAAKSCLLGAVLQGNWPGVLRYVREEHGTKAAASVELWRRGERERALQAMARCKFPHRDIFVALGDADGPDRGEH